MSYRSIELWFIDGNHEDFTQVERFPVSSHGRAEVTPRIWHLPRGYRWRWHGRTWLACGGGVSLDKAIRAEGLDWWPQEEITAEQEAQITAAGPADVLVSHDCPAGVVHTYPPPPKFWDRADLARSDAHQARLQRIVDAVRPAHIMHGHLHMGYQRGCDFGYGPVQVTGLNCDGGPDGSRWATGPNWLILDTQTMEWELPES